MPSAAARADAAATETAAARVLPPPSGGRCAAHTAFEGTVCLAGLQLPPQLLPDAVSASVGGNTSVAIDRQGTGYLDRALAALDTKRRSCGLFAEGRLHPSAATATCSGSTALSQAAFLKLFAGRTILFVGDSLMRQLFLRTVAWIRGQRDGPMLDPSFHADAVYRATASRDVLAPLVKGYGEAHCVLRAWEHEDEEPWQERNGSASRVRRRCLRGRAALAWHARRNERGYGQLEHALATAEARLAPAAWAGEEPVTFVYMWRAGYAPEFWEGVSRLRPAVVVAGAMGTHVPCWSDGKPGNRCSIEQVREEAHTAFWQAMRTALRAVHVSGPPVARLSPCATRVATVHTVLCDTVPYCTVYCTVPVLSAPSWAGRARGRC